MRLTGGLARGIPLQTGPSRQLRPAADRIRAAVFSSLGDLVPGQTFLDLFAGTGAYGLEALSRGASGGVFVEKDGRTAAALRVNLAATCKSAGAPASAFSVSVTDVLRWQPPVPGVFGLIFLDPPYADIPGLQAELFARCATWLSADSSARVIFEMPAELHPSPAGFQEVRRLGSSGRGQPAVGIYARTDRSAA